MRPRASRAAPKAWRTWAGSLPTPMPAASAPADCSSLAASQKRPVPALEQAGRATAAATAAATARRPARVALAAAVRRTVFLHLGVGGVVLGVVGDVGEGGIAGRRGEVVVGV